MAKTLREKKINQIIYITLGGTIAAIILFIIMFNIFTGKKNKSNISNIAENSIEQANSSIGKKVDDVKEQKEEDDDKNEYIEVKLEDEEDDKDEEAVKKSEEQNSNNNQNNSNNTSNNVTTPANEAEQANIATSIDEFTDEDINPVNSSAEEISNDPAFKMPVEGEIVKHFGKDKLIYSETLKEWTTHLGIDIKADKTTVVKAAADGTVKSIKNDPRYGLTVVLEHSNGFTSVYSNLLTAEFVVVGENVKSGQTLGTVGTSATFEILDDPHLHFEILKDGVAIDPEMYIR